MTSLDISVLLCALAGFLASATTISATLIAVLFAAAGIIVLAPFILRR